MPAIGEANLLMGRFERQIQNMVSLPTTRSV